MTPSRHLPLRALLPLLCCAALAACSVQTNGSATANVPATYSHVYVTVQQVWFNTNASTNPADSGWQKFTFSTPYTLDLVQLTNGALGQFASNLNLAPNTYSEMRLLLTDRTATLAASAQTAGALYNDEVDYTDSSGNLHQVPLEIPNAAQGIGVPITLTVAVNNNASQGLGSFFSSSSSSSSDSSSSDLFGTNTSSSSSSSSSTCSSVSSSSTLGTAGASTGCSGFATTNIENAAVYFDASRDLVAFNASGTAGFLLNPHPNGYDLNYVGTIQGQVDLSSLTTTSGTEYEVTAEGVSADGTHHVVVASAPLTSSGSFVLYPLSTEAGAPSTYDLVIHGPDLTTTIIKSVPVQSGSPSTASSVTWTGVTLEAASSFSVNLATGSAVKYAGTSVGFYQTLPISGEIPYLIETYPIDPITGTYDTAPSLSAGGLQYGTYDDGSVTLSSATPSEGTASYKVSGSSAIYGDGPFTTTVAAPSAASTTATFSVAAFGIPSGSSAGTVSGTLSVVSPGKYNEGMLILTQNGAIVSAASISAYLSAASSSETWLSNVPTGHVYYAEVWVWNSSDPSSTFSRQPYSGPIDLTSGSVTGLTLSVD